MMIYLQPMTTDAPDHIVYLLLGTRDGDRETWTEEFILIDNKYEGVEERGWQVGHRRKQEYCMLVWR